jgi:hypothetical protein
MHGWPPASGDRMIPDGRKTLATPGSLNRNRIGGYVQNQCASIQNAP